MFTVILAFIEAHYLYEFKYLYCVTPVLDLAMWQAISCFNTTDNLLDNIKKETKD